MAHLDGQLAAVLGATVERAAGYQVWARSGSSGRARPLDPMVGPLGPPAKGNPRGAVELAHVVAETCARGRG